MMNILNTYINMRTQWDDTVTKAQIARELSKKFGRKYSPQKLNAWENGYESLPRPVYEYLLAESLPYIMGKVFDTHPDGKQCNRFLKHIATPERS